MRLAAYSLAVLTAVAGITAINACNSNSTTADVLSKVLLTPNVDTVQVGDSVAVNAIPVNSAGVALQGFTPAWSSSNTSVATVDSIGYVLGVGPGSAEIRATISGVTDSIPVTVLPVASPSSR